MDSVGVKVPIFWGSADHLYPFDDTPSLNEVAFLLLLGELKFILLFSLLNLSSDTIPAAPEPSRYIWIHDSEHRQVPILQTNDCPSPLGFDLSNARGNGRN